MKTVFTSVFIFSFFSLTGQPDKDAKRDNIWLFGYDSYTIDSIFGGTVFDFSFDPLDIFYESRPMNINVTDASICDEEGNLLFYTNGIYVANRNHAQMLNGGALSPGGRTDEHENYGMVMPQGALALPIPGSGNKFVLFHTLLDYFPGLGLGGSKVFYSVIDMDGGGGLGEVVEKNTPILQGSRYDHGQLTAVRHGNGRDWWVLVGEYDTNKFRRILVSPDGIDSIGIQSIGQPVTTGLGQAVFSPDGTKYVRYDAHNIYGGNDLNIYDFDRCSGFLTSQIQTNIPDTTYAVGVAISQNSRFAYVSSYTKIYQYDLWADDILASVDTVSIYDNYVTPPPLPPIPTPFFLAQLAPDGKIYINANNSVNVLHVINNPDELGEACNIEQHGVTLAALNAFSMPNFPYFKLGKLEGSPCDTIILSDVKISGGQVGLQVYPNPAKDMVSVVFDSPQLLGSELVLRIFDITGREVQKINMPAGQKEILFSISELKSGVYFFEIISGGQRVRIVKVIVQQY